MPSRRQVLKVRLMKRSTRDHPPDQPASLISKKRSIINQVNKDKGQVMVSKELLDH